ncbi:hypothetical protein GJ744_008712 [Endocarpon pusillum]|uniref:Uncharacterized protein n=1 Tax=Endocarpon pusillum TaxID=364733 RepID=A0A8H7API7_9EURO|nr:hypothetical protein GJ744_008712 [Endocarpon pusillum]
MSYQSGWQAFLLPADGIEPEVIGADIGIYVGRNAQVQPDLRQGRYIIHAQNALTTVGRNDCRLESRFDEMANGAITHSGRRYNQSAVHQARATYGPTPNAHYQRTSMQHNSSYGSMQSQSGFGHVSSRANMGTSPAAYPLARQNTRSDTDERGGRSIAGFAPISRTSSQAESYTNTGHATAQPIAIAGRHARRDSTDSMYGFARSPTSDDLRAPPSYPRGNQQTSPYDCDRRYGR